MLFGNFKKGHRCKFCDGKGKWNQQTVTEYINNEGYSILEPFTSYLTNLTFKCPQGHTYKCNFKRFKRGDRCPLCVGGVRLDGKIIYDRFIEKGLIPKFNPNDYKNNQQWLYFLCPNHLKLGIQKTKFAYLQVDKYVCHQCYLDDNSGINHYRWRGGISKIHEYLRKCIKDWRNDSLRFYNFKCDISKNNQNLEVHHLHKSFSDIVDEVFEITRLEIKQEIGDYSYEELNLIVNKCIELHYKYGFGVVLTRDIHTEFHSIYGRKNNTFNQYFEFKKNYLIAEKVV